MKALYVIILVWESSCFAANPALFEKIETALPSLSGASAIASLEGGIHDYAPLVTDALAQSFAGVLWAQRCKFTDDTEAKLNYLGEAFPLLDRGVTLARKENNSKVLAIALRNRGKVFASIPTSFKKAQQATVDFEEVTRLESKKGQ